MADSSTDNKSALEKIDKSRILQDVMDVLGHFDKKGKVFDKTKDPVEKGGAAGDVYRAKLKIDDDTIIDIAVKCVREKFRKIEFAKVELA